MIGWRAWFATALEWALLGIGLGCLGSYGVATLDAHLTRQAQVREFERAAETRVALAPRPGSLVGMLDVPRLRLSTPVIEGDDAGVLQTSAGHLPDTPMPWQSGNSAIAGHRDGLFRPLKDVKIGDEVRFRTTQGAFDYRVTSTRIVMPDDLSVLAAQGADTLTLITCYPFRYVGAAPQRFVVHAERLPADAAGPASN